MGLNIKDLRIEARDFADNGKMDADHTKVGADTSPTLTISGVPEGTVELAVICHDPDAPLPQGWTHWVLYGIPADTTELGPDADEQFRPGPTDFGTPGYGGPLPPEGHGPHHYYFWVYALDRAVDGNPTRAEFLDTYADAIIEQNRIKGVFER